MNCLCIANRYVWATIYFLNSHKRESICVDSDWLQCHSLMSFCRIRRDISKWMTFNWGSNWKAEDKLKEVFEEICHWHRNICFPMHAYSGYAYVIRLCWEGEAVVVVWWWLARVAELHLFIYFAYSAAVLPVGLKLRDSEFSRLINVGDTVVHLLLGWFIVQPHVHKKKIIQLGLKTRLKIIRC